jgi:hypothetical protein
MIFCPSCGVPASLGSVSCLHCSATLPPEARTLGNDPAVREILYTFLVDMLTSSGLSEWLRDLGADSRGTLDEKRARLRQHTKFFTNPTNQILSQVVHELRRGEIGWSVDLCEKFGLSIEGSKPTVVRRIHRYVSSTEGQVPWITPGRTPPTVRDVFPAIAWYPIYTNKKLEGDHYDEFADTMTDIFGGAHVHTQMAVAHGTTLKIDFHIGDVGHEGGVGVEFKMPRNMSDVQKGVGAGLALSVALP